MATANPRGRWACFQLGGILVDLDCEVDEAKKAVRRGDAGGAAIGFEGAWLRARDVAREWPERAAAAMEIHDGAKRLAEELMGRKAALSYEEKRSLEMAALLMEEGVARLMSDARRECSDR